MNKFAKICAKAQTAIACQRGDGYLETAIHMLIAVVIGAALLTGLFFLFKDVVFANTRTSVTNMFTAPTSSGAGF